MIFLHDISSRSATGAGVYESLDEMFAVGGRPCQLKLVSGTGFALLADTSRAPLGRGNGPAPLRFFDPSSKTVARDAMSPSKLDVNFAYLFWHHFRNFVQNSIAKFDPPVR